MTPWLLRALLFVESCAAGAAAVCAHRLAGWQQVGREVFDRSPDAAAIVARLLRDWGVASGCCLGAAMALALLALERRHEIAAGPVSLRLQWAVAAVPVIVVAWTARGL